VFQFYHLLPELTLLENVMMPYMIRTRFWDYWRSKREFKAIAEEMLTKVGLQHRMKHKPSELSGGEMQRAAIARALVGHPEVLLADEPTGNLDAATGREIINLLKQLNRDESLTIIMVTHDNNLAHQAERIVRLSEGRVRNLEEAA
jgi:lipoprotein-releasing system ATP-binding protein